MMPHDRKFTKPGSHLDAASHCERRHLACMGLRYRWPSVDRKNNLEGLHPPRLARTQEREAFLRPSEISAWGLLPPP